jgi:hypothetical protein
MTEAEWLACIEPEPMLETLGRKASRRKLRVFAGACCRLIWHLLTDERSQMAVHIGEQFADGLASQEELERACQAAHDADDELPSRFGIGPRNLANMAAAFAASPEDDAHEVATATLEWVSMVGYYESQLCDRIHCIFGNPFHTSPALPTSVLAWNDGTVRRIADGIYDERKMPEGTFDTGRLAILADALLDAGCDNEELIQHCRGAGPHVRGCWAVDAILGKS